MDLAIILFWSGAFLCAVSFSFLIINSRKAKMKCETSPPED